jgi:hypothetical protein
MIRFAYLRPAEYDENLIVECATIDVGQIEAVLADRQECIVKFWNGSSLASPQNATLWISDDHYHVACNRLQQLHA